VGRSTDGIIDAVSRLLELMADPKDAEMLGPLVVDEIVIRLLRTAIGPRCANRSAEVGTSGSARRSVWIRTHFCATGHGRGDGGFRPYEARRPSTSASKDRTR